MMRILAQSDRPGKPTRREVLRVGSAAPLGLSLWDLLRQEGQAHGPRQAKPARALILIALEGGPSHIDLWDMKPDAPAEIRGPFRPIATTVPGLSFCEHLPRLAQRAHHLALVRSVHHTITDHNAGYYLAFTGQSPVKEGALITAPAPDNFPSLGAVVAKLRPAAVRSLPDAVHLPDWMSNNGAFLPGQDAGFLGAGFNPLVGGDPSLPRYQVPGLSLPEDLSSTRLAQRRRLLEEFAPLGHEPPGAGTAHDAHWRRAYELVTSPQARQAFQLDEEPQDVRERYGFDPTHPRDKEARQFGGIPHFGQCLLLARRLIQAGVRVVTVCSGARFDQTWDTHRENFALLERSILPWFDRGLAALLDDLHRTGLLSETLVVAMGEFGRTPRIGQITSSAGAGPAGRDHWPHCYSLLLAGGGVPGGTIHGASDRHGAYPRSDPVTPADIAATVFERMGIPPDSFITDQTNRPHRLSAGAPIQALT